MKKVIAFGTFDIFHQGHRSYLEQAKKLGEYLIVVVARDATVFAVKKKKAVNGEQERLRGVRSNKIADEVVLGGLKDKFKVLATYQPDVVALGYDQRVNLAKLREKLKEFKLDAKIVRLKAYEPDVYKSSKLGQKLGSSK